MGSLLVLAILGGCASSGQSSYGRSIDGVLEARRPDIERCHEVGAASQFGLVGGDLTVRFVIQKNGDVAELAVVPEESDLEHRPTLECVLGVIRDTRFPPPDKPTKVVYPMEFAL